MSFSLSILFFPYLLFLFIFALFGFFNLYHILRFGIKSKLGITSITIFIVGAFFILIATIVGVSQIDWQEIIGLTA